MKVLWYAIFLEADAMPNKILTIKYFPKIASAHELARFFDQECIDITS